MRKFLLVMACVIVVGHWNTCTAGLFDHDDKLPGEQLGYKQPCPINRCKFVGTRNGDLDLHMQGTHPKRYAAAMDVYNKGMFAAFAGIFKTFSSAASGGFSGTSGALQEFYSALCHAGADGQKIAEILSSDKYD